MTAWAAYDNRADEVIGVWNTYEEADNFLSDNMSADDIWVVFPYMELILPVNA